MNIKAIMASPAARKQWRPMQVRGRTYVQTDPETGRDRQVPDPDFYIEGGALMQPYAANISKGVPEGETHNKQWLVVSLPITRLYDSDTLRDPRTEVEYAVVSAKDFGDHFECVVRELA